MTIANTSQESSGGLPQAMKTAQESIQLPEVQEMLRRLSAYRLGIFMPHMHDEHTGGFQPLPDDVIQVESGMEVSFQPADEIANEPNRYVPVGWLWRAGTSRPSAVCEMVWEEEQGDTERSGKHKMKDAYRASSARPASLRRRG